MKEKFLPFILCLHFSLQGISQVSWVQKANFDGLARAGAVAFSIGTKGYIGTGHNGTSIYKDFWEWDQATNTWTQKADFGGAARSNAIGFSIGTEGYIGTGSDANTNYNDFWGWDQATNTWLQKANFPGIARSWAVGFAVAGKGYCGTGTTGFYSPQSLNDFWEYDPSNNAWTQKTNLPGRPRYSSIGFAIGKKGYIGMGVDSINPYSGQPICSEDLWEWDQLTNSWTQKANFPGKPLTSGIAIGTKAYVGIGCTCQPYNCDKIFWEWDQLTDTWTSLGSFPGYIQGEWVGFSIGNEGYLGTGAAFSGCLTDFWEFTPPSTNAITENTSDFPLNIFPNPTAGIFTIKYSQANTFYPLKIFNTKGEEVFCSEIRSEISQIDLSNLSKGVYFIEALTPNGRSVLKLVIL
jgi:N-acetylneuraminic acid mutarotase